MTVVDGWLTPTRLIGLIAYLFATIACCVAWRRSREIPDGRRLAAILGLVDASLLLDMAINGRWLIHQLIDNRAMANGTYNQRNGSQVTALVILCAIALVGSGIAFLRCRGRYNAVLAICGVVISVCFWCAEIVSLHAVDAVLYHAIFGIMPISLMWVVSSLMTGIGILRETQVRVGIYTGVT